VRATCPLCGAGPYAEINRHLVAVHQAKRCARCGVMKPSATFRKRSRWCGQCMNADGLCGKGLHEMTDDNRLGIGGCRACACEDRRRRYAESKADRPAKPRICKKGHPLNDENVNASGQCRICRKDWHKGYYAQNKSGIAEYTKQFRAKWRANRQALVHDLHAKQNALCCLCREPLAVEEGHRHHDHELNVDLGLAHPGCNRWIGAYRDNPDAAEQAARETIAKFQKLLVIAASQRRLLQQARQTPLADVQLRPHVLNATNAALTAEGGAANADYPSRAGVGSRESG
jgi:hypothetical protein